MVIHYTANNGDTAQNNADYFAREVVSASAHYFVDESTVVQSVLDTDTAWHCGGALQGSAGHAWYGICSNSNSIGIEMCSDMVNGTMTITEATVNNATELVKSLMEKYSVPVENVIRHYDVTGKFCPLPWVRNEQLWTDFKARLEEGEMSYEKFKEYLTQYLKEAQEYPANTYSKEALTWMESEGYMVGDDSGNLMPQSFMTREQYATVMHRIMQSMGLI